MPTNAFVLRGLIAAVCLIAVVTSCEPGAFAAPQPPGGATVTPVPQTAPTPKPATGGATITTTPPMRSTFPELVIGGRAVMRLRATAGGLSPDERAYDLRRRLGPILTLPNLSANDVTVYQAKPNQTASIYVRNRLLIKVDRNLAQANSTSIGGLAIQWANNLRTALPQINVTVRMFDPATGAEPR